MAELPDELSFNAWVGQQVCVRMTDGEPFFGVAGFVVGKTMGAAAACLEELSVQALRQADAALAEIIKALPHNTVVVVSAGRGCVQDSASDQAMQQSAIHVPLLVCIPNGSAKRVRGIVSTLDIAPTLYEIGQIRPPQRIQGQSLISAPPRGWAMSRLRNPERPAQTSLCTADWKLVVSLVDPEARYLYNMTTDTDERDNLADGPKHQDRLEAMIDLMIDARVALEDRTEPRIANF
ncbi:MAG: sulfatase-like hydrolase/transferase [Planktotalea sp.]|uniref:sulfatase-like hydrolase/transferase n=1 Tax=Planktotalea sp. TaxID=2029877 RepID=UPI003C7811C8